MSQIIESVASHQRATFWMPAVDSEEFPVSKSHRAVAWGQPPHEVQGVCSPTFQPVCVTGSAHTAHPATWQRHVPDCTGAAWAPLPAHSAFPDILDPHYSSLPSEKCWHGIYSLKLATGIKPATGKARCSIPIP